jgi:tetratricopeptide (TPR) repeat protein
MHGMMGRALILASVLAASSAVAQPTDAQKQQASDLVKRAIAKSQAGDRAGAIALYLEAYAIVPLPALLSNVGSEYQQLEKPIEALKYFCMYLEKDPTGQNATYATAQAKVLQKQLGHGGEVCAKPAEEPPPPPREDPPPPPPPTPARTESGGGGLRMVGASTAGLGLVSLGIGAFYGYKAKQNSDLITNHDRSMSWPANIKQIEADGQKYEDRQILMSIAGGALVATGVVVYVLGRSKRRAETAVTVVPSASPDAMGVLVRGGF